MIFDLVDKIDTAYNTISLLRTAKEEDDDDQEAATTTARTSYEPENSATRVNLLTISRLCSKCGNKLFVVENTDEDPTTTRPFRPLLENYNIEKEKNKKSYGVEVNHLNDNSTLSLEPSHYKEVDSPVLWHVCARLSVAPTCDIPTPSVIIVSATTTDALTINVAITAIANVVDVFL